ncbi:Ff.00g039760.m01.CDS01 [Fusarium sp. VM40]|nr:Ff.00g039760.m01.CDS01 [Fusarium sp. VM40]
MTFSFKHGPSTPTDSSLVTDNLTDHEIAIQMKLVSKRNKNDKRLGSAARRIRRSAGDWPWVWLKDILPMTWSLPIIENLGTLMPHRDLDEIRAFLHDAVKQRRGTVLKLGDVKRACSRFGLVGRSQDGDNKGAPTNDKQYSDEHSNGLFSDEEDATSGEGKPIKRRRLNKPEFVVEEDVASNINARTSPRNSRPASDRHSWITRMPVERKIISTVPFKSPFIKKILQIIRVAADAADEKVVDNRLSISATRDTIAVCKRCLRDLDAAAPTETTSPLTTSLEDANVARKAVEDGKAAFESNLVAMNMDDEVAEVVRRNYTDKLAAAEGKIDDIEKRIEAETLASTNAVSYRAELEHKIEEAELELQILQSLGEQYGNEVMFWVSIRKMVSLSPKGMKGLLDIIMSQGVSLDEIIQHQG